MSDSELTLVVLDKYEEVLGFLNPKYVEISERNELYKARTAVITCELLDDMNANLSKYDQLLVNGNKIWKQYTTDGDSCLYIIKGEKSYNDDWSQCTVNITEAVTELAQNKIILNDNYTITVNSAFIASVCGELYDTGIIEGPDDETVISGSFFPLGILNEIQNNTGGEFQYRYEHDPTTDSIKRYIDFKMAVGTEHETVINIKKNAEGIHLTQNEDDVAIAAGPTGKPSSATDEFNKNMLAWKNTSISKGQSIPLWVNKDSSGNPQNGPSVAAPYAKVAGEMWVECDNEDEIVANYSHIQSKHGTTGEMPRIAGFTTSESNVYNIYWTCVDTIRQHLQPKVDISCSLINLKKLEGVTDEYYNIGDTLWIMTPTQALVRCRITSTTKDPRQPASEQVEIASYHTSFMQAFFQARFKDPGSVVFE